MNLGRRSAARGLFTGPVWPVVGPVRRLVRATVAPAALLAASGAGDAAFAQLVPDTPYQPGAVQPAARGGFFGLVPDGPNSDVVPARQAMPPQGDMPATGYAPQSHYAPPVDYGPHTGPATLTPQQVALLRQQQAYRQAGNVGPTVAPTPGPIVTRVDHSEAESAAPARVSVLGAVMRPRTYEFSYTAPELGALLERAGGLAGNADRTVRVIRNGQQVTAVKFSAGLRLPLAAGDVVLCDPGKGTGPRDRHTSHIAMVGLTDRPVVLKLKTADANVRAVLNSLKLPEQSIRSVGVLPPANAAGQTPGGPLPDGTVLIFMRGSVTPAQWRNFRDVAFGDLVEEAEPEEVALADTFAPVRSTPRQVPTVSVAARQDDAGPIGRITPRRSARDERRAQDAATADEAASPAPSPLSTPDDDTFAALPSPEAFSLPPAPAPARSNDPTASLAAPGDGSPDGRLIGEGQSVVDVTDLYGDLPSDVAMLPAPGDSPFYGDGPAVADAGSHLMPLEDYPGLPGLSAPSVPGDPAAEPWRVADAPTTPGRYTDGVPSAPRSKNEAPAPRTAPQPLSDEPAKPIPAPAVKEASPETASVEKAEAGFPWLPAGLGLGALLGAAAAAFAARNKGVAMPSAATASSAPAATESAKAAATGQSTSAPVVPTPAAAPAAPVAPWSAVLEDLIADRLKIEEEAIRLPETVALHGRSAGMTKLRLQSAESGPPAPRFADGGVRGDGVRTDGVRGEEATVEAPRQSRSFAA